MAPEYQQSEAHHLLTTAVGDIDGFSDLEKRESSNRWTKASPWKIKVGLWAQTFAILCLILLNFHLWRKTAKDDNEFNAIYSPAQSEVRYVNIVSTSGFGHDISRFSGKPSPENNQLWSDLYNFGLSKIPIESAAQLVNRTVPIPGDPGQYIVSLDVFHELHCLNQIRQRLWASAEPELAEEEEEVDMVHLDHCIDMIRQNIMCSSDITPLPFIWDRAKQRSVVVGKVQRTCRDFDTIRQWALDRRVRHFDASTRVEDPLGNMEY